MKLTIKELLAFDNTYNNIKNEKMPLHLSFQLLKISNQVTEAISFYQTKFNDNLAEYAEVDETGFKTTENNGIVLKKETAEEARKVFKELDDYEFPISAEKILFSSLEKLNLSPANLSGLIPFIEEDE